MVCKYTNTNFAGYCYVWLALKSAYDLKNF